MEGRRDYRVSLVVLVLAATLAGTAKADEESRPPYDTPSTTVVYTTSDSAVVEAEKKGGAPTPVATHRKKSNCHLEAVGLTGEIKGLGQVSLPTPPDERAFWVMCDGENVGMVWRKITPRSSPRETPADVADHLRQEIPMPQVSVRINPGVGLAGSESWFWIEGYAGEPITNGTDAFGRAVEVEARPNRYEWTFGDGTTMVFQSTGRAYPERSEIRHVFERASANGYQVTVRFVFEVRYRVDEGAWTPLPGITRTASVAYQVRESQAVISR